MLFVNPTLRKKKVVLVTRNLRINNKLQKNSRIIIIMFFFKSSQQ